MRTYNELDKHVHHLVQVLTKLNKKFVPAKQDDSHTNLGLDALHERIVSRWMNVGEATLLWGIHLKTLTLEAFSPSFKSLLIFELEGKTLSEVESEVEDGLTSFLSSSERVTLPTLHYSMPEYDFAHLSITSFSPEENRRWFQKRLEAEQACGLLVTTLQKTAEIRLWPHHFDTGVYVEPTNHLGLGFGLAMSDSMVDDAYFYYSGYGLNGATVEYSEVKPLSVGNWITGEYWKGAVLRQSEATVSSISTFLRETTHWYLNQG